MLTFKSDWILLIIPLTLLIFMRLLGFDGMVGQDSYAYVDYAKTLVDGKLQWRHTGEFVWPSGYPLLGAIISFTGLSIPFSLQLISCLSLSGSLIVVRRILLDIYSDSDQKLVLLYLLLFGVFSPYYFRSSMLTTSDLLASLLVISGLYWICNYLKGSAFCDLFIGTIILSAAPYVRYASIVFSISLAIMVMMRWFRKGSNRKHIVVLLIPVASLLISILYTQDFGKMSSNLAGKFWSFQNYFSSNFATPEGYFDHMLPNIIHVFYPLMHYGFTLIGLPLLLILLRKGNCRDEYFRLVLVCYLTYALFLAGISDQNPRFLLPMLPFVLILCFYGFMKVVKRPLFIRFGKVLWVLLFTGQVLLCVFSFRAIFQRNALEQEIHNALNATIYSTQTLYSFDIDISLVSRGIPFSVINLWTNPLDSFEKGALLLFNEERLSLQWKDKNPMINWNRLRGRYHLREVEEFADHWILYQIEYEL
ncbi:MAG: hypothetical protein IPL46_09345 [Saprospiraceae bacterium]|nr:hypothetical protein [Saprospiraceae bacterium]